MAPTEIEASLKNILLNAQELYNSSLLLYRKRRFSHSIHFSIASIEECSKYLILFCKIYLPADIYRRRFQHERKHRISLVSHFIAGKVSILHAVEHLSEHYNGSSDFSEDLRVLVQLIEKVINRNDPQQVAADISKMLTEERSDRDLNFAKKVEFDRTTSLYVDLDDNGITTSNPTDIGIGEAKQYLENTKFSVSTINYIANPAISTSEFVRSLPRRHRADFIETSASLLAAVNTPRTSAESRENKAARAVP